MVDKESKVYLKIQVILSPGKSIHLLKITNISGFE